MIFPLRCLAQESQYGFNPEGKFYESTLLVDSRGEDIVYVEQNTPLQYRGSCTIEGFGDMDGPAIEAVARNKNCIFKIPVAELKANRIDPGTLKRQEQ